eukprot:2067753-Rhodomonas_salina.1
MPHGKRSADLRRGEEARRAAAPRQCMPCSIVAGRRTPPPRSSPDRIRRAVRALHRIAACAQT